MYCINCGVKLADTEKRCPLCETEVYHPALERPAVQPLYPAGRIPAQQPRSLALPIVLTTAFLMPILITLLCDLRLNGAVTWSGYVIGALLLAYVILGLPTWFRRVCPVTMLACDFLTVALYLLYINHAVGGSWFWGFGFPLVSAVGIAVTAVVLLMQRHPRQGFYIFGGAFTALGGFMPLLEHLINRTFGRADFAAWSVYPLVALVLLGLMLIFLGANSAARRTLERKFFL